MQRTIAVLARVVFAALLGCFVTLISARAQQQTSNAPAGVPPGERV